MITADKLEALAAKWERESSECSTLRRVEFVAGRCAAELRALARDEAGEEAIDDAWLRSVGFDRHQRLAGEQVTIHLAAINVFYDCIELTNYCDDGTTDSVLAIYSETARLTRGDVISLAAALGINLTNTGA